MSQLPATAALFTALETFVSKPNLSIVKSGQNSTNKVCQVFP